VEGEIGEGGEFEKMLSCGWLVDNLVLKYPSEVVGDEDGVKTRREGRVDVGAGGITNHPGVRGLATVMGNELTVGIVVFFGQDLDGGEMGSEPGAVELVGLLLEYPLSDEDQAVTAGEISESFGDVGEEFDLLISDGLGEAFDTPPLFRGERDVGELLEAGDERPAEAVKAISV
jgi:hypothetical protein